MGLRAFFDNTGQYYNMDGPHISTALLNQRSGVYLISTQQANGTHKVIDVGESHNIQHRVSTHDRAVLWSKHMIDRLYVSVIYCDEQARMLIEQQLRAFHNPPVGER